MIKTMPVSLEKIEATEVIRTNENTGAGLLSKTLTIKLCVAPDLVMTSPEKFNKHLQFIT